MRKLINYAFIGLAIFMIGGCLFSMGSMVGPLNENVKVSDESILQLKIEGIIFDSEKFLKDIKKYSANENIKGVLVLVNSPGGVVGPSQEMYTEIKRVREELQKPVVVSAGSLVASGAYYAAVGADRIVTNPGTLMGSIGVIMEFANLERLYDWAKIKRYVIKTGAYKDSGSDTRPMREDEKALFQEMIDSVHGQFKKAVAEGRKLSEDVVAKYSDGRIFTGERAVKLGFADQLGTREDALRLVGELSGLGSDPEVFEPPKKRPSLSDLLAEASVKDILPDIKKQIANLKLVGQPLLIYPSAIGF